MSKNPFDKFGAAKTRDLSITGTMAPPEDVQKRMEEDKDIDIPSVVTKKTPVKTSKADKTIAPKTTKKPAEAKNKPEKGTVVSLADRLLKDIEKMPAKEKEEEVRANYYIRKSLKAAIQILADRKDTSINSLVIEIFEKSFNNSPLQKLTREEIMSLYQEAKIDKDTYQVPEKDALQLLIPKRILSQLDNERESLKKKINLPITKGIFIEILILANLSLVK